MKITLSTLAILFLFCASIHTHATTNQVSEYKFFQEKFNVSLFEKHSEVKIKDMLKVVNSGHSDAALNSNLKSFIELGFSDELIESNYLCSTNGCVLFLGLDPNNDDATNYRANSYISNIDNQYWYDFESKDVFESNNRYFVVLLK
ncbi:MULTISPECIES: hypothetical protein [unclassified Pseudoalteromonas]|uniref:hypothetical protein n=1 Tax=unclassified Pseudoalteromonas TaxID=194690 RepID=UPI003014CA2B